MKVISLYDELLLYNYASVVYVRMTLCKWKVGKSTGFNDSICIDKKQKLGVKTYLVTLGLGTGTQTS